ncbi:MAG: cyclic pyranopterin monophosphate synthase MoaC [Planctomycetota bacterium]
MVDPNLDDSSAPNTQGSHGLTHLDARGRASMVDVSHKPLTARRAVAEATIRLDAAVRAEVLTGNMPKGEVLAVARIAGIQAAKDTARLIPLCHSLPLSYVAIDFEPVGAEALRITAEATTVAATGVEMEALVAASVAALTVYDMVKAKCRAAVVENVQLVHKSGGKSGVWDRAAADGAEGDRGRRGKNA